VRPDDGGAEHAEQWSLVLWRTFSLVGAGESLSISFPSARA